MGRNDLQVLGENITSTSSTRYINVMGDQFTVMATGKTISGSGAATIEIHATNVPEPLEDGEWVLLGTIDLTLGTAKTSDGFAIAVPWDKIRAKITAISGTGATLHVYGCGG